VVVGEGGDGGIVDGVDNGFYEVAAVRVAGESAVELGTSGSGEGVADVVAVGGIGVGNGEGGVGNGSNINEIHC